MLDPSWEPPTLREKQRSYWWVWLIILILIIGVVVYYFVQKPAVVEQKVGKIEAPTTPQVTSTPEAKSVFKSEAPSFDSKCTVAAGIIPGSITNVGNKITFTFKNNGKEVIEGSYFEASNEEKKAYRKNTESLSPGAEATYTIDLNDVSSEVGINVKSFIVLPVQNSKACINQRMIVIQ